jgi:hypothetical protein
MRKRIWISCGIVLAFCLLLFFWAKQPRKTARPETNAVLTETNSASQQLSQEERPNAATDPKTSTVPHSLPHGSTNTPLAEAIAKTNPIAALRLATWQSPIDFYGKVVDENSNAIAGAQISFHWVEIPDASGNRDTNSESDAAGLFSLHGQRGPDLSVSISKEGYYATRGGATYGPGNPDFSPNASNPVVFQLRKKGKGEPLIVLKRNYSLPRDGKPVSIDLSTGATMQSDRGNLVIQCLTEDQEKASGGKYNWRCVITIPRGGVTLTHEEPAFLAPENGYTESTEISMPSSRQDWKDEVNLKLYYWLPDGRYGRMNLSIIAGGQHFCIIDSALNPSGSRNLEPVEVLHTSPPPPLGVPAGARAVTPEFK